jgi:hypothetical protein
MAAKRRSYDLWNMKKLAFLSLVGVTSIALLTQDWPLVTAGAKAASAVAVSIEEAFVVAVSTGEVFAVAVAAISVQCAADTRSPAADLVCGAAATGGAAIGVTTITDSMMSSSFPGGGTGAIRTDITVTTIIPTITMGTPRTVTTTVTSVIDTVIGADSTPAADQGITTRAVGGQRNNFVRRPRSVAVWGKRTASPTGLASRTCGSLKRECSCVSHDSDLPISSTVLVRVKQPVAGFSSLFSFAPFLFLKR